MMDIAKIIRDLRAQTGIKQQVLADELNVDVSAISLIESGKREVKVYELEKIARCFKISVVDLVGFPNKYVKKENKNEIFETKMVVSIELKQELKDEVMKLVLGDNNIKLLKSQ